MDVRGYDDETYGEAFADVYDDWYHDVSDIESSVATLADLACAAADDGVPRVVELGVGTGRLAVPLAAAGIRVAGIDTSAAMLARLAAKPGGDAVTGIAGDMVDRLPAAIGALGGPAHVVFVAYNTFFSLLSAERQADAFAAVAAALHPGGCFVLEAFVPEEADQRARRSAVVGVRSLSADRVVLSIDTSDPAAQRAEGQYVEFTEAGGVRLRPWAIRWSTPAQLDAMAVAAGLRLEERWSDFGRAPFDPDAERHVSLYRCDVRRPGEFAPVPTDRPIDLVG